MAIERRLAAAGRKTRAAVAERNRLIIEAKEVHGLSLRDIAVEVGLSFSAVRKILEKERG